MVKVSISKFFICISTLLSGCLLTLAFAPFHLWFFAFLSPAALLLLWQNASPKQAFWRGLLFGLGFIGTGLSWIYISLHVYGQANPLVAGGITAAMVLLLASYFAVQGYVFTRFFPQNCLSKYLLAFPVLWVLQEWLRGYLFTGFPWLFLGYSQLDTPLRSFAPVIGVYGLSWLVALISSALALIILLPLWEKVPIGRMRVFGLAFTLLGFLTLYLTALFLSHTIWTHPTGNPIQVSLIQGNIPQTLKWQSEQVKASLATYARLTKQHLDSSLIIWPEAAITIPPSQAEEYLIRLEKLARTHNTTVITGIPVVKQTGNEDQYYNAMIAVGNGSGTYLKRHLVPFGEVMPLKFALQWLKAYVEIPMSDFSRGKRFQPLITAAGIPIAAFICYEITYPTEVLDPLPQGQLLVTISDDSWFGDSIAPAQHLQIAQMRALETGRYSIMSTNDGISAIINAQGHIEKQLPRFEEAVLTGTVQSMTGSTPWMRIGIYPIMGGLILLLLVALYRRDSKTRDCFSNNAYNNTEPKYPLD